MKAYTRVTVELFKYTGKFYTSFSYDSELKCFDLAKIKLEAKSKKEFINKMDFTIEVESLENNNAWNKYLFSSDSNK